MKQVRNTLRYEIARLAAGESRLEAVDFEANRKLAMSTELGQYRMVHFATHGLINNRHPELSGIVLSLIDEQGQPQMVFCDSTTRGPNLDAKRQTLERAPLLGRIHPPGRMEISHKKAHKVQNRNCINGSILCLMCLLVAPHLRLPSCKANCDSEQNRSLCDARPGS